jgi:hypothetical protein
MHKRWVLAAVPVVLVASGVLLAQRGRQFPGRLPNDRAGVATWENEPRFKHDVFTFVRVQYDSAPRGRGRSGGVWFTDWPDSDLNFSFRLQQLTSLRVNPEPIWLRLTDKRLFDYPFIYIVEPGRLMFTEEEVLALRRYLLNGGFLMVDDFWGDGQWNNWHSELKRAFPDRDVVDLELDHEIFHCVYDLKEKPQIPSIEAWRSTGLTYEPWHGGDCHTPHFRAMFDDKGRMMSIMCHNTDLGDGWEREGDDPRYFQEFSVKKGYPMGINIVFYAMTH